MTSMLESEQDVQYNVRDEMCEHGRFKPEAKIQIAKGNSS
jgi:hypothetical protein